MKIKDFLEAEYKLAVGKESSVSLEQGSNAIVGLFLRAIRGRTDLSEVVSEFSHNNTFISRLEKIKTNLRKDRLEEALLIIESTQPQNSLESIELNLEKSRYYLFSKRYKELVELSNQVIGDPSLPEPTKMTFHQIRGLAYMWLGQFDEAISELSKSITLSSLFPKANPGYIAQTVLAQTYSYKGDRASAESILTQVERLLEGTDDKDEWIEKKVQHLRSLFHFAKNFLSEKEAVDYLTEAMELASWLELKVTERMCLEDFKSFKLELLESPVKSFSNWCYLPRLKLVLMRDPKSAVRLDGSDLIGKILDIVSQGPIHQVDLFEKVWEIPFKKEYSNHLRAILSKVRVKLPPNSLIVQDKIISLK